jgi:hypothetical protein
MSSTTIDQSGDISSLLTLGIGTNVTIQVDSGTKPPGGPVVVTNTAAISALLDDSFTVQDGATFITGAGLGVAALDRFIIGNDGTLELSSGFGLGVGSAISFSSGGTGGDLIIDPGVTLSLLSSVEGFKPGDGIDFSGTGTPLSPTSYSDSLAGPDTSFTITMAGGAQPVVFDLAGNLTGDKFYLQPDGGGGFVLSDTTCFAPGTRILTESGEVAIEQLRAGDIVVLADGREVPIVFIGRRMMDLARHNRPLAVRPVRIAAGALADGVPARPLTVSPDHAFHLDGVLVQAKDLIDGVLVTQDMNLRTIMYYHVEIATHGILLAEGAPAESYLDTGHRGFFDNADEPVILHPDLMQMRREAESIAPLCTGGPALAALRARLHARKLALGYNVEDAARMILRADLSWISPEISACGSVNFKIPNSSREFLLASPVFVPAETDPASGDRRALGIALAGVLVDGRQVPPESLFGEGGLHEPGAGDPHVWTKGCTPLMLPRGTREVTFQIAAWPRQWHRPSRAA